MLRLRVRRPARDPTRLDDRNAFPLSARDRRWAGRLGQGRRSVPGRGGRGDDDARRDTPRAPRAVAERRSSRSGPVDPEAERAARRQALGPRGLRVLLFLRCRAARGTGKVGAVDRPEPHEVPPHRVPAGRRAARSGRDFPRAVAARSDPRDRAPRAGPAGWPRRRSAWKSSFPGARSRRSPPAASWETSGSGP